MEVPTFEPMLATLDGRWPTDPVIEPKWDGARAMVTVAADGAVTIRSRQGKDVTSSYPELRRTPTGLERHTAVFDGEIVAVDDAGRPSFQLLQRRMNVTRPSRALVTATPVYFVAFDIVWADGHTLTSRTLADRRAVLDELIGSVAGAWQTTYRLEGPVTDELLDTARKAGLEGLVLKGDGPYRPGRRSAEWVKVKFRRHQQAVIGGRMTDSRSLCLGVMLDEELRYVGQVGMAMARRDADQLDTFLVKIRADRSPFADLADDPRVVFVRPHVVVSVSYLEVTAAGTLRQPLLDEVRPDLEAQSTEANPDVAAALVGRPSVIRVKPGRR